MPSRSWILLGTLAFSTSLAAAEAPPKPTVPVVQVVRLEPATLADVVTYPARVEPKVKAAVLATSEGVVTKVRVAIGHAVKAGETLLALKNTDPVYEYVPVAVAAPVAGVVSALDVSEGSRVVKGQALATVIDPRQMRLVVEIPAADAANIKTGLAGNFLLPAAAHAVAVEVTGVSPLVDPLTGTSTAELALRGDAKAPLGAIGKVTFAVNQRQGLQVPEAAIAYRGTATFVRVVAAGKAKQVDVKLGATRRGMTEIAAGLAAGADVIVRSSAFVADGQDVVLQAGDVAKK